MKAASLAGQATELRLALNGIRAAIAEGAAIDLVGLDGQIAQLLDAAQHALPTERAPLGSALEKLLQEVDAVGIELRLYHDFETARRAADAYRSGAAVS
jgi:hypothetical protein